MEIRNFPFFIALISIFGIIFATGDIIASAIRHLPNDGNDILYAQIMSLTWIGLGIVIFIGLSFIISSYLIARRIDK